MRHWIRLVFLLMLSTSIFFALHRGQLHFVVACRIYFLIATNKLESQNALDAQTARKEDAIEKNRRNDKTRLKCEKNYYFCIENEKNFLFFAHKKKNITVSQLKWKRTKTNVGNCWSTHMSRLKFKKKAENVDGSQRKCAMSTPTNFACICFFFSFIIHV